MQQIQFIGIGLKELVNFIDEIIKNRFEDLKSNFQPKEPTEYLTRNEVAKLLKIDISSVHNWTKRQILQAYQIGGRVYFKRKEIEEAIVKLKR